MAIDSTQSMTNDCWEGGLLMAVLVHLLPRTTGRAEAGDIGEPGERGGSTELEQM